LQHRDDQEQLRFPHMSTEKLKKPGDPVEDPVEIVSI
jgi:hypothetical protein